MENFDVSLKVITSTVVDTSDDVDVYLHFFHINTIASFTQQIHKKWVIATLEVVVICFQEKLMAIFELVVVDKNSPNDMRTIKIQ
jgi:hypothetical protein